MYYKIAKKIEVIVHGVILCNDIKHHHFDMVAYYISRDATRSKYRSNKKSGVSATDKEIKNLIKSINRLNQDFDNTSLTAYQILENHIDIQKVRTDIMALCMTINELNINLEGYSEDLFKPIGGQRNDLAFIVLKEMKRVYESNLGVKVPLTIPTENTRKEHEFMIIMRKIYTEFGISADPYVYLRQVISKQDI